ncbi:MAG: hypothetical protein Q4P84_06115 [Elusimicrobiales bacterium]|nr:hypothetical protein [Elusimicrobiales bacterium]
MDNSITLHLIDFAPLLQLAAGFFVMFIAIDVTKSFSSLLSTHVFDFKGGLARKISEFIISNESLSFFDEQPHFQTGDGRKSLEITSKNIEKLNAKLNNLQKSITQSIDDDCRCDVFRYLSIYMFIFCLATLFMGGFREYEQMWLRSMVVYSILSYVIVIITASCNKKVKKCSEYNQTCILFTAIITIVIIVISFLLEDSFLELIMLDISSFSDWFYCGNSIPSIYSFLHIYYNCLDTV